MLNIYLSFFSVNISPSIVYEVAVLPVSACNSGNWGPFQQRGQTSKAWASLLLLLYYRKERETETATFEIIPEYPEYFCRSPHFDWLHSNCSDQQKTHGGWCLPFPFFRLSSLSGAVCILIMNIVHCYFWQLLQGSSSGWDFNMCEK
jgi:hypothetical protein